MSELIPVSNMWEQFPGNNLREIGFTFPVSNCHVHLFYFETVTASLFTSYFSKFFSTEKWNEWYPNASDIKQNRTHSSLLPAIPNPTHQRAPWMRCRQQEQKQHVQGILLCYSLGILCLPFPLLSSQACCSAPSHPVPVSALEIPREASPA